jgi:hypothetical protein
MAQEKRTFIRFNMPLEVKFKKVADERYIFGVTSNFSRRGLCFTSDSFFDLDTHEILELRVKLPRGDAFVSIFGDVMWTNQDRNKSMAGIMLRAMDKEAKWEILDHGYTLWLNKMTGKKTKIEMAY